MEREVIFNRVLEVGVATVGMCYNPVNAPTSRRLGGPATHIPGLRLRGSPSTHQALQEQLVGHSERHFIHVGGRDAEESCGFTD